MPHLIVSTVALLSNLYKNAPLIVGDKDSDPDLMRFLGARLTTNYPACGSPPMYVMHAPPRTVFDNLEKRGFCIMSAQTIQEHSVWILARPRVPADDKVEISRGGPNDKSVQAFDDDSRSPPASPSGGRKRSPNKTPRLTVTRSSSKQSLREKDTLNVPSKRYPLLYEGSSVSQKLSLTKIQDLNKKDTSSASPEINIQEKSPNRVMLSLQLRGPPPRRKTSRRTKKVLPNKLRLSVQVKENSPTRNLSSHTSIVKDKPALIEPEASRSRSISPEKRNLRDQKRMVPFKEEKKLSCGKICTENVPSHPRSKPPDKKISDVTSKGDAGTFWLGSEKVHMGIQASNTEVSMKRDPEVMSRVTFDPRNHTDLFKTSVESIEFPPKKSALKRTSKTSTQTKTNHAEVTPRKTGTCVHFEKSNAGSNVECLAIDSSTYELPKFAELNFLPWEGKEQFVSSSEADEGNHILKVEESTTINEASVSKDSVILRSLASRCSHIAIVDNVDAPMIIDITDPSHLTCLTHDSCCCEDT